MSFAHSIPNHLRRRREKVFGDGRPRPLDREAKVRIMARARALKQRTEKGKHYGLLTAKCLDVLEALLWGFHNARSGLCFPSQEKIAERAKCARSTVAEAIKALEDAGILSWVNRIVRVKEIIPDLFGQWVNRWRVLRTSNAYQFTDPKGAGGHKSTGLQGNSSKCPVRNSSKLSGNSRRALSRWRPAPQAITGAGWRALSATSDASDERPL